MKCDEGSEKVMRCECTIASCDPQVRDQLPHLKAIIQYEGRPSQNYPGVYAVRRQYNQLFLVDYIG